MDVEHTPLPKAFSIVQQRRVWAPLKHAAVCPSMDLVALVNGSNQLTVHRLFTWDVIGKATNAMECCWRPDGRVLAIAANNGNHESDPASTVFLYSIEGMLRGDEPVAASAVQDGGETTATGRIHSFSFPETQVSAFGWFHVNANNPAVDEEMWDLRFKMLKDVIAGGASSMDAEVSAKVENGSTTEEDIDMEPSYEDLPSLQTPLSVLAVVTGSQLHLYAHGRYPIVRNFELPHPGPITQVVASDNLVHWVLLKPSNMLYVVTVDPIREERYNWQAVSALHCHISQLLSEIKASVSELINLWQTTLKQLDWKLDGLDRLFSQYYKSLPTNSALLEHSTNAARNAPLANAADQFFTSAATNDQLLQRLERSLQGSLTNLKKIVRKQLVQRSKALSRAVDAYWSLQWECACISSSELQQAIASVSVPDQDVYDCLAWLRASGSAHRAAGTAANSTQRHNAIQRRLSDAQWQRMIKYWKKAEHLTGDVELGATEKLLGMDFRENLEGPVNAAIRNFEQAFERHHSCIPDSSLSTASIKVAGEETLQAVVTRPGVAVAVAVGSQSLSLYRFVLPLASVEGITLTCGELIVDVGFCGNDGKSSLDPSTAGPEGQQKVGIITRHAGCPKFWLVEYDNLPWERLEMQHHDDVWQCKNTSQLQTIDLRRLRDDGKTTVLLRNLDNVNLGDNLNVTKVSMSGSRGIGVVYTTEQGGSVEVLDLEDHEGEAEENEIEQNGSMEEG